MAKGKITLKDNIDKELFTVGEKYAKSVKEAIEANEEWLKTFVPIKQAALEYNQLQQSFQIPGKRKEFLILLQKEEELRKKTALAAKAEEDALTALERKNQALINTEKKKLDLENKLLTIAAKKERAQKRIIKLTEREKLELRIRNRSAREAAVLSSKLSTAYEKLAVTLIQLKREYKDVAIREGETSLKAKLLRAEIQKLDRTLKKVDAGVGEFQRNVGNYGKAMQGAANAARAMAGALGLTAGITLFVQVMRDAFNTIVEFDRQLIAVGKTIDISGAQLRSFGGEVISLGLKLKGISIQNLLETAEVAGQLGVRGSANILRFSETIEKLRLTSDLAGQDSARAFAKFIEISSDSVEHADRLGSVITVLGNNFATTESKILHNTIEIQKGIAIYKTSATDVLALGAATEALGSQAEASRGALQTTFKVLNDGAVSGKNLEKILKLTGQTQAEFKKEFGEDSVKTFQKFIKGLSDSAENGENLSQTLGELGLDAKRVEAVIGVLATNYGVLESAMSQANDEYKLNTALTKESEAAAESITAKIDDLKDSWKGLVLGIEDGDNAAGKFLKGSLGFLAENLKTILSHLLFVTKAFIAYKAIVKLARVQQSLMNKQLFLSRKAALASAKGISRASLAWAKFNKVLKSNILGIVVVAVTALVYIFNKLNKSIVETAEAMHKSNIEFQEQATESQNLNEKIGVMADRYDELTSKAELNKEEQAELDKIIKLLAKHVPDAVTEIDKYGVALEINTGKVEEFTKANNEILALEAKIKIEGLTDVVEDLTDKQDAFNRVNETSNAHYITGFGLIKKQGNGFVKLTSQISKTGNARIIETKLTDEQRLAYLKLGLSIDENIVTSNEDIKKNQEIIDSINNVTESLEGKSGAQGKANEETEKEITTLTSLKKELKALRAERELINVEDKDALKINEGKILAIQKEIDAIKILSKTAKDAASDGDKTAENQRQDAFKLSQFTIKETIKGFDEIAKNEESSFAERLGAIKLKAATELKLAESTKKFKLKTVEEGSKAELLIIAQFEAEKARITGTEIKGEAGIDTAKLQQNIAKEKAIKEKALNDELIAEEELFRSEYALLDDKEAAIEAHERRVAEIKKKYALEALNSQVADLETLISASKEGSLEREKAEKELSDAQLAIAKITTDDFIVNEDTKVEKVKLSAQDILAISSDLASALSDLANAIFDRKIQDLETELDVLDASYQRKLELAQGDDVQTKLLEDQHEKRRLALEAKIKKEKIKQAKADKAAALIQAAISTALGIINATNAPFPLNIAMPILVGLLGTVQIAAIASQPIPKYAKGTEHHKGGWALVGEERPEVISEPGKKPYIQSTPAVLDLPTGTKVTPSIEEYKNLLGASMLTSVYAENNKLNSFKAQQPFDIHNEELLNEMQLNTRAIERLKTNVYVKQQPTIDLEHELFKINNTNWG